MKRTLKRMHSRYSSNSFNILRHHSKIYMPYIINHYHTRSSVITFKFPEAEIRRFIIFIGYFQRLEHLRITVSVRCLQCSLFLYNISCSYIATHQFTLHLALMKTFVKCSSYVEVRNSRIECRAAIIWDGQTKGTAVSINSYLNNFKLKLNTYLGMNILFQLLMAIA